MPFNQMNNWPGSAGEQPGRIRLTDELAVTIWISPRCIAWGSEGGFQKTQERSD